MFALGDLVFTCVMHEYMTEVACFVGFVMGYFIIGPSARRRNRSWRVLAASRLERVMRPAIAADGARARTAMSAMAASQFEPNDLEITARAPIIVAGSACCRSSGTAAGTWLFASEALGGEASAQR
eukprot:CAMPEP_0176104360 /NCGR_PEP_ID=MMETSP0120_2-20121206/52365_1 /TAXON_ID=160619 /ORGANISM="Kryptoperidinium foliaceum, Strain CCMP 1326" /LENGTH=125 /DNA_ID=CAMNT_0017438463 /DNA_START=53 /DNA_END=428 /DNA_ORIENTATION=+